MAPTPTWPTPIYDLILDEGDRAVRAWLVDQGFGPCFEPGDLRRELELPFDDTDVEDEVLPGILMCPMTRASFLGELTVCRWLYHNGAAEDVANVNSKSETAMHFACMAGHLSVCEWLYEMGADGHISLRDEEGYTPMIYACLHGRLPVCEWLFAMGAGDDVTRVNHRGDTPMTEASQCGYLSICKWLYKVGAAEDITRATNCGNTPMHLACMNGHLSVCEWLFDVGATDDTRAANVDGKTPMYYACRYVHEEDTYRHLPVCQWLVLNGAMNELVSISSISSAVEEVHVSEAFVELFNPAEGEPDCCPALLEWAWGVVANHRTFLHVVLRASVLLPASQLLASSEDRCHLPRLPRDELERIGSFLGVESGRRQRNVREFAEALEVVGSILESQEGEDQEEEEDEEFLEEFLASTGQSTGSNEEEEEEEEG